MLAADLRLESARPIADGYVREAERRGLATARLASMPSVVYYGEESTLVALRAASEGYPLRGELRVADRPFGTPRPTRAIPARGEAWADSRLLARLGAALPARIRVGAHELVVTQVLDYRPDQGMGFSDLSTTLLINLADMEATELIQPGSRVRRAELFAGDPAQVAEFGAYLLANKKIGERLETLADASPQIRDSSERSSRFLSLASLVSVLLSAVAVAMAARRYSARHLDQTALMKCMGATQGFVLTQTVAQLVAVAIAVALVGTDARVRGAGRALLPASRPGKRRAAGSGLRRAVARSRHGDRDPGGLRAAAAAAAEACAAGARAAPEPRAAAATVPVRVRPCDRLGSGAAAVAASRCEAGALCRRRYRRDLHRARARRGRAGQVTRTAARRRRRRLALRAREHCATRPRQRRADHRLRPGTDGAAAARAGARRPARGVARQPAGRCAQLLHDQHPPRRGRSTARFLCGSRPAAH